MTRTFRFKWFLVTLLTLWASNAQSNEMAPAVRETIQRAKDGFKPMVELAQAHEHLTAGDFVAAFDEASRVLTLLQPKLKTSRRARFVAAMGLLLRADIRVKLKHAQELILADEQAAAELGSRRGYYGTAARALILNRYVNFQSTEIPPPFSRSN